MTEVLPQPPFTRDALQSLLWHHLQFNASGGSGGGEDWRSLICCVAVGVAGLPRTLSRARIAPGLRDNLVAPLMPCVDVYLTIGFGYQPGGMQATIALANESETAADTWLRYGAALTALRPMSALHTYDAARKRSKESWCLRAIAKVESGVGSHYDWIILRAMEPARKKLKSPADVLPVHYNDMMTEWSDFHRHGGVP